MSWNTSSITQVRCMLCLICSTLSVTWNNIVAVSEVANMSEVRYNYSDPELSHTVDFKSKNAEHFPSVRNKGSLVCLGSHDKPKYHRLQS